MLKWMMSGLLPMKATKPIRLMISVLSVSLVAVVLLTNGCLQSVGNEEPPQAQIVTTLSPREAFDLIKGNQGNPNFIVLDVRSPEQFTEGHIKNAVLLDYSTEPFRDALDRLDKGKIYLVYERDQCERCIRAGASLIEMLKTLGFIEAYTIWGGFEAWATEGFPIAK